MSLSFLRFFFAFLLILPFLWPEREKIKIQKVDLPALFAASSLMITLTIALFYQGILKTSTIDAAVLTMSVPIFSVLLGWLVLKEKVFVMNLLGIGAGLVGALFIIGLPSIIAGASFDGTKILGDSLIVLSSLSFVVGAIISKRLLRHYSTLTLTGLMFLVGAVSFLIPAIDDYLKNPSWIQDLSLLGIIGLAYITLASSITAFFLFEWGLKRIGVIKADLFQYIEPLIATTLAVLILQEKLQYSMIIGGILIGLGVYWGTLGKDAHKHHKAHRH